MRLIDAIPVREDTRIAFVGAGGKSSAMFRLARQALTKSMQTILLSATTHLSEDQIRFADQHITLTAKHEIRKFYDATFEGVVLLTGELGNDQRTKGLSLDMIAEVEKLARAQHAALLIEADGSRRKPLKAPAGHEPVIPPWVEMVVVVAGLSGLGQELIEEHVHRSHVFGELSGLKAGEVVRVESLARVLLAKAGGLKGIPKHAWRVVLLNQCDTPGLAGQGKQLSQRLLAEYGQVILSNLDNASNQEVIAVHRRVAAIVLAAGGSVRMGQPKQLLLWQGMPFVRAVAQTAQEAGLWPVVVVTGANRQRVEFALNGMAIHTLHNLVWKEGQASSVRTAVDFLTADPTDIYGAIFFLVDQPQIQVSLVRAVLDAYSETLSPIVAPLIDDRRGNPVLFDQSTFVELGKLQGDSGGRQVFSRFQVRYVPWLDARAGLDVDTQEDYQRLLGEE